MAEIEPSEWKNPPANLGAILLEASKTARAERDRVLALHGLTREDEKIFWRMEESKYKRAIFEYDNFETAYRKADDLNQEWEKKTLDGRRVTWTVEPPLARWNVVMCEKCSACQQVVCVCFLKE